MSMSIYLCGFMGCGKSHVGRVLSKLTDMPLVDLDSYIVAAEKMTIPEIFAQYGEAHFRELESKYLRELSDGKIVATGGGTLINDSNAEYVRENGISIFINTIFITCYERIQGDKNRPLVVQNTKRKLHELFKERRPIYKRNSVYTVNGNTKDKVIADEILKLVKFYENRKGNQ